MQTSNKVSLETYLTPYQLTAFSVSDDESYLVYSINTTGAFNLWKMDLADISKKTQLTFHNEKVESIAISNESIFFTSDKNGNENMQIYSINQSGVNWKDIRTEANCRYFFGGLSEDGTKLYYTSTKDNPMFLSIFSYNLQTHKEILLHKGKEAETYLLSVSPNGKDFAYFVRHNHSNMEIFLKKDGQDIELISQPTQPYRVSGLCFMNENKVLFSTDYKEEFAYLASYDLLTGVFQKVVQIEKQDIEKIQYHAPTGKIFLETKAGPIGCLYEFDILTNNLVNLQIPTDTIQQCMVTPKGNMYVLGASSTKPPTLFRKRVEGKWELLFENQVPYVSEDDLIRPKCIHYLSYDGVEIEAMFYEAKEEYRNGHTIVYPHGGPQYNEQTDYYGFFQYLLRSGFHIFAPNFRGTPNYGTSFLKLIEGDWGGGPRFDVLYGIDTLVNQGRIEADKIILFGGSYGGYLSLLLFGRHPERFKACVDMFGPSNLFTLIETCPEHWKERMNSWIGNPIKDRERLIEHSPMTYVINISKPILIIQGANDPRVKQSESDQIVEALRQNGKVVDYIVYEDEGHGFTKKENELKAYQKISQFLKEIVEEQE